MALVVYKWPLARYEVGIVASTRNHEKLIVKSLGASACIDQSGPPLIDDILTGLKGKPVIEADKNSLI